MIKKIIVTADDYGMCPDVTQAIDILAGSGAITSTNVMMNFGTDFSQAKIKNIKDFSIGLHWNVTVGKPVIKETSSLVDQNGDFFPLNEFRARFRQGKIKREDIIRELSGQYDLFFKYFGQPIYWNTHENVALYPKEYLVFQEVALSKGIKATRNFQRVYIDYDKIAFKRKLREFAVSTFINLWFGIYVKRNFAMPEGRILAFENSSKLLPELQKLGIEGTKAQSIEIVIHPALSTDNPLFGNISNDRVLEYEMYNSPEMRNAVFTVNAKKATFEDIIGGCR